jgi:hypothetical protein
MTQKISSEQTRISAQAEFLIIFKIFRSIYQQFAKETIGSRVDII